MEDLKKKIDSTIKFIKSEVKLVPDIGIILGTGLGDFAKRIDSRQMLSYSEIPYFPKTTVSSHKGQMVFGEIGQTKVVAMEGRLHYYEGHSLIDVTYPVRVMKFLGAKILIVSNAAGGINSQLSLGSLMIITDHINLMGVNPLIGPNEDFIGPRFPDMSQPYDRELIKLAEDVALGEKIKVDRGVYVGVTGPNLETAAEYRFLKLIGADAVGMSTVPEVIVAVHCGLRVLAISCITDKCLPDALKPADIKEIIRVANDAEPRLTKLIFKVIEKVSVK